MTTPFKVWSKFSVTKQSGTIKFRAVEPPLKRIDEVVNLVFNYFVKEEAHFKATGVATSKEASEEYKAVLKQALTDGTFHMVVCCLDNDNDDIGEIIGGSFISLTKKDEPLDAKFQPQTKELKKMFEIFVSEMQMYDLANSQNVDQYYDGRGVVVHPKYRGFGIAQELLRTRRLICKENGVPLTSALMTAYGSQKAAERDGWETVFEYSFEDLGKKFGVTFEDCPPTTKLMVARPT